MEIAMEFATFCNICFNKNNLRKIEQTEDLTRILILFIENRILITEQEIYLCLNCCEKLESYDKFKEMCLRNFIDFRIEYSELKKKLEIMNDPNMENKLRNFIETKVCGTNDTLNFDSSKDPLNVEYNVISAQKSDNNIPEKDDYNYNLHNVKCKTEKIDYDDIEDYKFNTELDLNEENPELPLSIEHMKIESYIEEDIGTNDSNNKNELVKQSTSTGPNKTKTKSCDTNKTEKGKIKKTSDVECDVCNKTFPNPSKLKNHKRIHTGEKPYACKICNQAFTHFSTYKRHTNSHSGVKPYACPVCYKTFAESGSFRRHELVHSGKRPFSCEVCQKSFRELSTFKNHKLIHTGEKPYSCKVCNKSFRQSIHLREHEFTHTGIKPYECDICKRKFRWSSDLSQHKIKCFIDSVQRKAKEKCEKS